jgi:hypothetical protein
MLKRHDLYQIKMAGTMPAIDNIFYKNKFI